MSQIDDWLGPYGNNVNVIEDTTEGTVNFSPDDPLPSVIQGSMDSDKDKAQFKELMDYINKILNTEIGQVTNRSDIINPDYILAKYNWTNSSEHISLYNRLRSLLVNYQNQQQASYDDWYNSTFQQALRDQAAGLNTDLLGVSGSNTAGTASNDSQPFAGVPTTEEISFQKAQLRNQKFATLIQSVGTVANLASAFSGLSILPLQKDLLAYQAASTSAQTDSINLSNLSSFENLIGTEISSRLSDNISSSLTLGKSLDINEWFSNEDNFSNIFESYAPSDNPLYRSAYSNVRKRMQNNLAKAYEQGKVTAENQGSFSAVVADPTYSPDQLIQIAQLRPYMQARRDLQIAQDKYQKSLAEWNTKYQDALSVRDAVDAANARNEYDAGYYAKMDSEKIALYDSYIKEAESIRSQMRSSIDKNLMEVYNAHPYDVKGFAAAYAFDNAGLAWYEYLGAMMLYTDMSGYQQPSSNTSWNGVEVPSTNPLPSMGASPSPSPIRGFIYPGSLGF